MDFDHSVLEPMLVHDHDFDDGRGEEGEGEGEGKGKDQGKEKENAELRLEQAELEQRVDNVVQMPLRMNDGARCAWRFLVLPSFLFVGGFCAYVIVQACVGVWVVDDEEYVVCGMCGALLLALPGLGFAVWSWLKAAPREEAFQDTKESARKLLARINQDIAQEREQLGHREAADIASVCALPNDQRAHVQQRLPVLWALAFPVRLVLFVVAGLVLTMPDSFLLVRGDHLGLTYRAVVRPWVRLLVRQCRKRSERIEPRLNEALASLAHDAEGVEFVVAGLKKEARALVKIRDDYLTPTIKDNWVVKSIALNPFLKAWGRCTRRLPYRLMLTLLLLCVVPLLALDLVVFFLWFMVPLAVVRSVLFALHTGKQAARVVDMARGSLVCESARHMLAVHSLLMEGKLRALPRKANDNNNKGEKEGKEGVEFEVVRFKNSWADESEKGYVQLLYNVRVKGDRNGVITEVQVTHRDVFKWRRFTHKPYKVLRADNADALVRDIKDQTVGELKSELVHAKERLKHAEGRAKESEGKLKEAEGKLKEAEGKLKEAEGTIEHLRGEVAALRGGGRAREGEGESNV